MADRTIKTFFIVRKGGFILLVVAFFCIVSSSCENDTRHSLVLSKYEFEYGKVRKGTICTGSVVLYNKSKKDIHIQRVNGDCGCTYVVIDKRKITPGDSTILHFSLDTKNKKDEIENFIIIEANTDTIVHYVRLLATVE